MFYSKSTNGFYTPEIHGKNIPEDAVEISDKEHKALLAGQTAGMAIVSDAKGRPKLVDPETLLAPEQLVKKRTQELRAAYEEASQQLVSFTSSNGTTALYQTGQKDVANLQLALLGCLAAKATPKKFYWISADNVRVPFTYDDLTGLAAVMFAQGLAAFQAMQDKKAKL
jgi:phosphosulfolactate phosphohydrolase-like enzyme